MSYKIIDYMSDIFNFKNKNLEKNFQLYMKQRQTLRENYIIDFLADSEKIKEHLKTRNFDLLKKAHREHLKKMFTAVQNNLDNHIDFISKNPEHINEFLNFHKEAADTLLKDMPLTKSIVEKVKEHPLNKARKSLTKKVATSALMTMAGALAMFSPQKAEASSVAVMSGLEAGDFERSLKKRQAHFSSTAKSQTKMTTGQ
ncbi:MAG: hypothetical protein ACTHJ4_01035, partial [Candidatus Nucleicultricaceae bacterium]